jgi:hypothetical protein
MKFLTFDYVDKTGKETSRQVIQLYAPSSMHFCIDVAELEPIEMVNLQKELEELASMFKASQNELLKKYGVSKNFRFFKPENMTNITEEV